jgi:hypothetical protein
MHIHTHTYTHIHTHTHTHPDRHPQILVSVPGVSVAGMVVSVLFPKNVQIPWI